MKHRLAATIILIAISALLTQACSRPLPPQESCNFVQNPEMQRVSWQRRLPVKLYIHESVPVEAYDSIDKSIREYNLKLGGGKEVFKIIARGVSGDLNPKRDGYSMLYWFKSWDSTRRSEQARTTIYWTGSEIFEADIRINAANFSYSLGENTNQTQVDFVSLLVHELGHVLGLGHTVTAGSVMNFSLDEGQNRRELDESDLASLKCEY
ncbi:MAG: matrixin family metalloprotease [Bdellovibrionaceae bacterium]|nr:matrixin family metalloprotease [Pseudobdellovibrionaceae bacterium]